VLDSISQAAVRGKLGEDKGTAWAVGYLASFQPLLSELFSSIMQCPDKDKVRFVRPRMCSMPPLW
jgi:hypothetical protein